MRCPSATRLVAEFRDLDRKGANLIRRLAHACDDRAALSALIERECPATHAYARNCYNDPYDSQIWRVTMTLHAIDRVLGTYGNAGDPYATTLIYTRDTDTLRIGCWGDIVEKHDTREEW